MGRRSRQRARQAPGGPSGTPSTSSYTHGEGNTLTLRDQLSAGTLRRLNELESRPAASAEDRSQRRTEFLFERMAMRWEIAGLPLEGQKELLGRYRLASAEERNQVRAVLAQHLSTRHPGLEL